ncbi:hypothetical protein VL20_788 [Microcystis panniformis FACHB-1757]|uniref:Uncharacterized protein n=1 Tax=Microcystis panniformis FACHB-1757 TaxID=1638788 RepID=A0A0K1RW13_9CHRO|nr:hypothetical protein VL20_788 [Microcystis panniformis FACHB-1757]
MVFHRSLTPRILRLTGLDFNRFTGNGGMGRWGDGEMGRWGDGVGLIHESTLP